MPSAEQSLSPSPSPGQANAVLLAKRKSLFWRIHFWAALIATPFAVLATLTGLLYVFTPQIEAVVHHQLDEVAAQPQRASLSNSVAAAQAAAPSGMRLRNLVVPNQAEESLRVIFEPKADGAAGQHDHRLSRNHIVYVDPYSAKVLGSHDEMDRFNMWSKRLHSSLLQGDGWRWLIELSASWLMVMLATGVYLWWPRKSAAPAIHAPTKSGRQHWRVWHSWIGVGFALMSLAILLTGLTWSKYAGEQIKILRDATGQKPPSPPKGLKSDTSTTAVALSWDQIVAAAKPIAPDIALLVTPPRSKEGVWRITNFDRGQPTKRFDVVLDAYNAKVLSHISWQDQTAFSKATAIGIPFHRGEFGWWNQALLVFFGLGLLASVASGWVMWLKRRGSSGVFFPRLLPGSWRTVPAGAVVTGLAFAALMPLLAYSAAAVAALELLRWGFGRRTGLA